MVDRTLFPNPPSMAVLVPAPAAEIEPLVRAFWRAVYDGDPAFVDSFWAVIPGSMGYAAALDYRCHDPRLAGVPAPSPVELGDLLRILARHLPRQRLYQLVFERDAPERIAAYEYHSPLEWAYMALEQLRAVEPDVPADPWLFAESRGIVIERRPVSWPSRVSVTA